MPKLPPMTVREVETILGRAGFVFVRQTDHRIWRHPDGRAVSVPAHRGDLRPGTLRNIVEQAGMTVDEVLGFR
ncbi:MAG TPA: type II toxin-antitoxin system HicA family toxin [Thermomicrobiales bacterium]|jgi:predicted RNA binding protein YcfA (HicA-like mRNA interferase family)